MTKYETCTEAAIKGDLEALKSMHSQGYKWDRHTIAMAAREGHLECLQYLHTNGCPWDLITTEQAAIGGKLECLQYAHSHGCPWNENIPLLAAGNGNIDCLQYAHSQGCLWDEKATMSAAKGGHLECLQYLHTNGCPWDYRTCMRAAAGGKLECLQYAHQNGCEWNYFTCIHAAANGHLNCLQYAHQNGCPWNENIPRFAAGGGYLDCLQYAHQNGCPWNEQTTLYATINQYKECLDYAIKHGCPYETNVYHFLLSQYKYLNSLNESDKLAIKMYTGNYFFRAINAKEQGLLDVELLPTNWRDGVSEYCKSVHYEYNPYEGTYHELLHFISYLTDHLNKIILSAPELKEPITVYRGVKTPYFLTFSSENKNETFTHKGFISTSLSIDIAKRFALDKKDNTLQYMLKSNLKPGLKCIYYENEQEVILPTNTKLKVKSQIKDPDYIAYYEVEYI
jgi:hypothetical protein